MGENERSLDPSRPVNAELVRAMRVWLAEAGYDPHLASPRDLLKSLDTAALNWCVGRSRR